MNILIVCSEPPYPTNHGGRLDVMQKIKVFNELGHNLDILFVGNNIDDAISKQYLKKYADQIYTVNRKKGLFSFILSILTLVPYQIISRRQLKNVSIGKNYDLLLLESDYVSYALKNSSIQARKKILRVHNDECKYFRALMYSTRGLSKVYYYIESHLFRLRKNQIYQSVDQLWFISKDECLAQYKNGKWLPPNMPIIHPFNHSKYLNNPKRLLFVGNLFTPNNLEAIVWFLDNSYKELVLIYPLIKLIIAGSCKGTMNRQLEDSINSINAKNIELIINPTDEELTKIYNQNIIFVNSMLHGAGVKLKTIDAIRNSIAVVSTSIGVEGTGLLQDVHYKLANTSKDFIEQITFFIENVGEAEKIASSAYNFVANNFDIKDKISEYTSIDN